MKKIKISPFSGLILAVLALLFLGAVAFSLQAGKNSTVKFTVARRIAETERINITRIIAVETPAEVLLDVPFTSQAPHSNWAMPYQEACEEASIIMTASFLENRRLNNDIADQEILRIVEWEQKNGFAADTNIADTAKIAEAIYGVKAKVYYDNEVTIENIKQQLAEGNPVILPAAGRLLENPNFTPPGPEYHMLVVIGFDGKNFITNDPGTRNGHYYEYPAEMLIYAIHDWKSSKKDILEGRKAMLVLEPI